MDAHEYRSHDAVALAALHAEGAVDAASLLALAQARLAEINPVLNAVCVDMSAIAADRVEQTLQGPFGGVPFLIKDIIQDYAGVPTTSGSRALQQVRPGRHADYTQRVLDAGMVIFGKTTTPELALKGVTESDLWGATRNPWHPDHTPGGSSGGAAAAVAAGVVPMAGANDGGGSIRIPASHCGLFGLRPSRGRVPVTPGIGEQWEGASSDGVVSRSVRDSARMLNVLSGPGRGAPFEVAPPAGSFESAAARAPGRLRIGWSSRSPIDSTVDPECIAAVEQTATALEALGHDVTEAEPEVDGMLVARAFLTLYCGQVAASVDCAVAQGARESDFEPDTRTLAVIGRAMPASEYILMRQRWNDICQAVAGFYDRFDLWLSPTVAAPPVRIGALDTPPMVRMLQRAVVRLPVGGLLRKSGLVDRLAFESLEKTPFTQLANLTGQPSMSVPMHWTGEGLPVGAQFTGPWGSEEQLISLAAQLETAHPWFDRTPPLYLGPSSA